MERLQSSPFGDLLKRHRMNARLTQGELAERAGLSLRTVSDLERGINQTPRRDTLSLLLDALDLSERDAITLRLAARAGPRRTTPGAKLVGASPLPVIGRDTELRNIGDLLQLPEVRLVTLVGAGGVGKTRLAMHVAASAFARFRQGTTFVSLASVTDVSLVPFALAAALDATETAETPLIESILNTLAEQEVLLVIDNFEHVMGAAPLLAHLLRACPSVKLLVTSRTVLRLSGEYTYRVRGLATPPQGRMTLEQLGEYGATLLFLARAAAAQHGFRPEEADIRAIAEICKRLDGLPLAIELAAACVTLMPPRALVRHLDNRFELLTRGARDAPPHQQTLRGTLDWSYGLLGHDARTVLSILAVFPSGCSIEGLQSCVDSSMRVYDALSALIDQSLITHHEGVDDESRFTMLETTRAYVLEGLERSGEVGSLKLRQAEYCYSIIERAAPHARGRAQATWLRHVEAEHANMQAALLWCLRDRGSPLDAELGLRLTIDLAPYWTTRGHLREARMWLEKAVDRNVGVPPVLRARARSRLGLIASMMGHQDTARAWLRESLELFGAAGDREGMAATYLFLGSVAAHSGDRSQAETAYTASLTLWRELGDLGGIARCLTNLAELSLMKGKDARARTLCAEGLEVARELGDKSEIAHATCVLALVLLSAGEEYSADRLLKEALTYLWELGETLTIVYVLDDLAGIAAGLGEGMRATRLLGAAQALRESIAAPVSKFERERYDQQVKSARSLLNEKALDRAWDEGRAMALDQAIAYALAEDAQYEMNKGS